MDDELEDQIFYQTYASHMKALSKFAVGFSSVNSPLAYLWKLCRLYLLRPEVILCGVIIFIFLLYLQAVEVWSRSVLGRLHASLNRQRGKNRKLTDGTGENPCWKEMREQSSAFAILGRRPRMEDRFIIEENINNNTGISFFAVFDGHGGEFAADFAKDVLVINIYNKIIKAIEFLNNKQQLQKLSAVANEIDADYNANSYLNRRPSRKNDNNKENEAVAIRRRDSLRKSYSTTDECSISKQQVTAGNNEREADIFTSKLNSLMRGKNIFNNNNKDANNAVNTGPPPTFDARCYIENGKINFGKMITDEVLAADYELVEVAKKKTNIAGTTALIAVIQDSILIVANVGDSRGVMMDFRGIAIPLSFDHKPQQVRERLRIREAGGFIAFKGVWRVVGILATSRALGDYPLKSKNLVIANPDILTFDLNDHKPSFLILATDGLWDTFSNEEACNYIKKHLSESDFGAKSLTMESYNRGSVDNITVLVIVFKNGAYRIGSASSPGATTEASNSVSSPKRTLRNGSSSGLNKK